MQKLNIDDIRCAEAIYSFCQQSEISDDYARLWRMLNLSMLEYVCIFKRDMFKYYCRDTWNFEPIYTF